MTRRITWLIVLSVCGGILLCSGRTAWADKGGGCGEDEDGNPNLLTIYHSSDGLVPDDMEDEAPGAITTVVSDGSPAVYVRIDVCVPEMPVSENDVGEVAANPRAVGFCPYPAQSQPSSISRSACSIAPRVKPEQAGVPRVRAT